MEAIRKNDPKLIHSGFYNIYPIQNEISVGSSTSNENYTYDDELVIDDFYGRVFEKPIYYHYYPINFLDS